MQSNAMDVTTITPAIDPICPRLETCAYSPGRYEAITELLDRFAPIRLAEMDAVALMDRVDTKYILHLSQLPMLLATLPNEYGVLEVAGLRLCRYLTLYFDTDGLDMYVSHHNGRSERHKIRSRSYLDSGVSFLEVKRKTNKDRIIKERVMTATFLSQLDPKATSFVESMTPFGARSLQPTLWNAYSRITLVSDRYLERATIDVGLRCWAGERLIPLEDLAVIEVKQPDHRNRGSPLATQLRALGLRPTSFSKYCVGIATLYPGAKHNRFKPILTRVEHIMRGNGHVQ